MPSASMPSGDSQTEVTIPTIEYAKMRYEDAIRKKKEKNDEQCLKHLKDAINAGDQRVVICPSDALLKKLIESGYTITSDSYGVIVSWVEKAPAEKASRYECVVL